MREIDSEFLGMGCTTSVSNLSVYIYEYYDLCMWVYKGLAISAKMVECMKKKWEFLSCLGSQFCLVVD